MHRLLLVLESAAGSGQEPGQTMSRFVRYLNIALKTAEQAILPRTQRPLTSFSTLSS